MAFLTTWRVTLTFACIDGSAWISRKVSCPISAGNTEAARSRRILSREE